MMIGENHRHSHCLVPQWHEPFNPTVQITSPSSPPPSDGNSNYDAVLLSSLRRYFLLPELPDFAGDPEFPGGEYDDDFYMYDFKVRKCNRVRAHDWTDCPFAHPGEKARRRDPRKYDYSGSACSEFRKGGCRKGDACEFAHGVFECWLHPTRFRTQPCKDGSGCKRRVCFFAHSPDQLRAGSTPGSDDGSMRAVGELAASLRNLQLGRVKSMPSSWTGRVQVGGSPVLGSPRSDSTGRTGFFSLPNTPTRPRVGYWDSNNGFSEEGSPVMMERVESGRELRARIFEKLSKENPLTGGPGPGPSHGLGPDFRWVSDLIE